MTAVNSSASPTWARLVGTAVVMVSLTASGGAQGVHGLAGPGRAPTYLALGDSYPYGSNEAGVPARNDNFHVGYPDYLQVLIDRPLVNLACPGETTSSFLTGDPRLGGPACPAAKDAGLLHVDYTGGQMDFAEAYLSAHDRVVLITLQLGANDFKDFVRQCRGNAACLVDGLPGFEAAVLANFDVILSRIRGTGYSGPIVVVEYAATSYGTLNAELMVQLFQVMASIASGYGAETAPVFDRFQAMAEPFGGDSCAAGLLITNADGTCDVHPTEAGHRLIASIIAEMVNGPFALELP